MRYFILDPTREDEYGLASRDAIDIYAGSIKRIDPKLSKSLFDWLKKIENYQEEQKETI